MIKENITFVSYYFWQLENLTSNSNQDRLKLTNKIQISNLGPIERQKKTVRLVFINDI